MRARILQVPIWSPTESVIALIVLSLSHQEMDWERLTGNTEVDSKDRFRVADHTDRVRHNFQEAGAQQPQQLLGTDVDDRKFVADQRAPLPIGQPARRKPGSTFGAFAPR